MRRSESGAWEAGNSMANDCPAGRAYASAAAGGDRCRGRCRSWRPGDARPSAVVETVTHSTTTAFGSDLWGELNPETRSRRDPVRPSRRCEIWRSTGLVRRQPVRQKREEQWRLGQAR